MRWGRTIRFIRNSETKGLTLDGQKVAFPAPSLPLDLPATAEKDELKKIVKADFTLADFVYTAVDAPSVKKTKFKKSPGGVIWQYDYWFIVYGPLKALDPTQGKDNPLEPQVVEQGDTRVITTILDPKTLAKFDIKPMKSAKSDESFISQRSELFGLVDVHATNHILATQEDDSWLIATHTDHRFDADPALANEWEPILDAKKGQAAKPKRQKSDGGGGYTKITSLKSVQGHCSWSLTLPTSSPRVGVRPAQCSTPRWQRSPKARSEDFEMRSTRNTRFQKNDRIAEWVSRGGLSPVSEWAGTLVEGGPRPCQNVDTPPRSIDLVCF